MKTFLIRILTVCICAALLLPATVAVLPASAEEGMKVAFEESFDDYENGVNATATRLSDYFNVEANAIGDGFVKVEEDGNTGNLYLMSHVFTQIYTREPIKGAYEMSFTTYEMQGGFQSGVFFRAPCARPPLTMRGMPVIPRIPTRPVCPASGWRSMRTAWWLPSRHMMRTRHTR